MRIITRKRCGEWRTIADKDGDSGGGQIPIYTFEEDVRDPRDLREIVEEFLLPRVM